MFYSAIRKAYEAGGLVIHSYAEPAMAETELRTLHAMKAVDMNWTALAKKFLDDLLHHVAEEVGKLFSAARGIFSEEEALMMGQAFEHLKPFVKEQSLAGTTLDMVANILPSRFSEGFLKNFAKQDKRSA